MILPHLKPILFAKNIIKIDDEVSQVKCEFPFIPTLPMICEAAAQASASFNQNNISHQGSPTIGFLISLKEVTLLSQPPSPSLNIKLKKSVDLGNIREYSFEAIHNNIVYATGTFTVVLQ